MLNPVFEQLKNKTRILISGKEIVPLLFYILDFHDKKTDRITESESKISDNDFVIYVPENLSDAVDFNPTIFFFAGEDTEIPVILNSITGGGIFIYPQTAAVEEIIERSENYFRKLAFTESQFSKTDKETLLQTPFGELPVRLNNERLLKNLDGVRLLCQQLGIMEEEFYEALMAYNK